MPGVSPPFGLRCPECQEMLKPDRTKINVEVDVCPAEHGILFDRNDILSLVGPAATEDILKIAQKGDVQGPCPNCAAPFRECVINQIRATGCSACGAFWFATRDVRNHVVEVRRRAYGEHSMAARFDVVRDATSMMPGDVVAGILTDFQLEHNF